MKFQNLQLRLVKDEVRFELVPVGGENLTQVVAVRFELRGAWHRVGVHFKDGMLNLDVDMRYLRKQELGPIEFSDKIMFASSHRINTGMIFFIAQNSYNNKSVF